MSILDVYRPAVRHFYFRSHLGKLWIAFPTGLVATSLTTPSPKEMSVMALDHGAHNSQERLRLLDAIVGLEARINTLTSIAGNVASDSQFEILIQQVRDVRKLRAETRGRLDALEEG